MTKTASTGPLPGEAVEYPDSDELPMADGDPARKLMVDVIETLEEHFAADPDAYVSGNILVYYEEGNPRKRVAPDVLVALGIGKHDRDVYKVWQEGKAPDCMMELASKSTWRKDLFRKVTLYCALGVQEYFLFDRTGEWFPDEPLLGLRLDGQEFLPIEPDETGRLHSETLGLELSHREGHLELWDPATGHRLRSPKELKAEAEQRAAEAEQRAAGAEQRAAEAERRLQEEAAARRSLEERLEALEARLKPEGGEGTS